MKVLHVISSGGMYGAEAVILNLVHAMREAGHESVLGIFSNSAQPNLQFYERAVSEGLEAHLIACEGQADRTVPQAIRALAKKTGADVVHAHGYKADIYVYLAMCALPTPIVSTCHNWIDSDLRVRVYGVLDRWVLRRYAAVVTVSEPVGERLLRAGVRPERICFLRNGIDLRPFEAAHARASESSTNGPLAVGFVGRLSHEKGADLFVRAAGRILKHLPQTRFLLVGDGPEQEAIKSLVRELHLGDRVALLGRCDDMPAFYASLDLLVLSSRTEGLPMTLLEGMASSLAIVATAVGAVPSVVESERTGLLIAPEDEDALAAAMSSLLADRPRRVAFGAAGHAVVAERYSAARMADEYLRVYKQVLDQAKTQNVNAAA